MNSVENGYSIRVLFVELVVVLNDGCQHSRCVGVAENPKKMEEDTDDTFNQCVASYVAVSNGGDGSRSEIKGRQIELSSRLIPCKIL